MRSSTSRLPTLFALSAHLTTVWLALAPGLVVCMEEDGRIAVEASIGGGVCGDATPPSSQPRTQGATLTAPAAGHCEGCQDVPLFLSSDVAAEHQHAAAVTSVDIAGPSASVLPAGMLTQHHPVTASAKPTARIPSLRTTILRI